MKKILACALFAPLFFACSKDSDKEDDNPAVKQEDIASIDNAVQSFMTAYAIPGVSIAITKNEKLVYAKSYGKMSASDTTRITNSSLFRIASISKPITAVGILKLFEANKLTLDSKVFGPGSILGADYPNAPAFVNNYTVRQLLNHTTGQWTNAANDPMFAFPNYTHQQLITWALNAQPEQPPGYRYSNFGYCLLGRIIEKLSGKGYEQFIKDEVLSPAGISTMRIGGNKLEDRKPNEVIYNGQGGENPYLYNIARMDSHGGWIASATDLARFMVKVDGFNNKADLLKPATITSMTTPPSMPGYALGWSVNSLNNWWHTGSLPGTSTELIRGANGFNMVILTNTRSIAPGFDAALDNLLWPAVNNASTPWQDIDQF